MNLLSVLKALILPEPVHHEAWQRYRTGYPLHQRTEPVHETEHEVWLDLRIEQIKQRQTGAIPQLLLPAPATGHQTGPYRLPHLRRMHIAEVPTDRQLRRETTPADQQEYAGGMSLIARVQLPPDFAENAWLNDPLPPPVLKPLNTDALAAQDRVTLLDVSPEDCEPAQDDDVEPTIAEQDRALYQLRVMLRAKKESE
jgi:hypothetical protein